MPISLGELATRFGCELIGDPDTVINDVSSLRNAGPESLSFLSSSTYKEQLPKTRAAAVVLRPDDAVESPVASLLSDNPYAMYARMAAIIHPQATIEPGVHSSAVVADSARVAASAQLAAAVIVGERSQTAKMFMLGRARSLGLIASLAMIVVSLRT